MVLEKLWAHQYGMNINKFCIKWWFLKTIDTSRYLRNLTFDFHKNNQKSTSGCFPQQELSATISMLATNKRYCMKCHFLYTPLSISCSKMVSILSQLEMKVFWGSLAFPIPNRRHKQEHSQIAYYKSSA